MALGALVRAAEWPTSLRALLRALLRHSGIAIFALLMGLSHVIMAHAGIPSYLLTAAGSLAAAWLVISGHQPDPQRLLGEHYLRRGVAAGCAECLRAVAASARRAGLGFNHARNPAPDTIDRDQGHRVSGTGPVGGQYSQQLSRDPDQPLARPDAPSVQVLLTKIVRLSLMVLAVAIVMSAAGIDLSVFALFSGAVGVGLGFGLQKIVANFISGVIFAGRQVDKTR